MQERRAYIGSEMQERAEKFQTFFFGVLLGVLFVACIFA